MALVARAYPGGIGGFPAVWLLTGAVGAMIGGQIGALGGWRTTPHKRLLVGLGLAAIAAAVLLGGSKLATTDPPATVARLGILVAALALPLFCAQQKPTLPLLLAGLLGAGAGVLTAALMSTVDTLINAVSAVTVNDIYKPYFKAGADDRHYLKVARIVSLSAAGLGIALVPLFNSFDTIYGAHAAFTASVTPPVVVAIVLGAFWKRYTPQAAFWTLVGGMILVGLSIAFPVLITPFAHPSTLLVMGST